MIGFSGAQGWNAASKAPVLPCSTPGLSLPGYVLCPLRTPPFPFLIKCLPGYCSEMTG